MSNDWESCVFITLQLLKCNMNIGQIDNGAADSAQKLQPLQPHPAIVVNPNFILILSRLKHELYNVHEFVKYVHIN